MGWICCLPAGDFAAVTYTPQHVERIKCGKIYKPGELVRIFLFALDRNKWETRLNKSRDGISPYSICVGLGSQVRLRPFRLCLFSFLLPTPSCLPPFLPSQPQSLPTKFILLHFHLSPCLLFEKECFHSMLHPHPSL